MRILLAFLLGLFFMGVTAQAAEFQLEKAGDNRIVVKLDGKLFTEYLTDNGPKPILWPIIGPHGIEMTRAFPMREVESEKKDHPHQRSFWFTHGNVNGVDFWAEKNAFGAIQHQEWLEVASTGPTATIATRNLWVDSSNGTRHLSDVRRVSFSTAGESRLIDFDITLQATERDVVFGDTKEGTFGVRIPTVMDVDRKLGGQIVNSEGLKDATAWGKRSSWVDYHGPVDGKLVGIAILNHPSSFRYPTWWHVRGYGLFAANPFGVKDFERGAASGELTLKKGDSISLRYRVVIHSGNETDAKIAELFSQYSTEKK